MVSTYILERIVITLSLRRKYNTKEGPNTPLARFCVYELFQNLMLPATRSPFFVRYHKTKYLRIALLFSPYQNARLILPIPYAALLQQAQDTLTHSNINRPL